jgi:LAO/AO transport system kinase
VAFRKNNFVSLTEGVLAGDRLSLARLLTQIENDTPAGRAALDELFAHTGRAHIVGITGAPGAGKSSLVNGLARALRNPPAGQPERTVAIVAVDPSSPFTGGALLGDRVRMRDSSGDPGVFIRSMASRGTLGGLARATAAVVQAMDAAGYDWVLIETVGAGQSEVDIARLAHTTVVVEAPGMGDDIQAIKAGILEIADVIVVNKADRPGVENTERALRAMLDLGHPTRSLAAKHGAALAPPPGAPAPDEPLWIPEVIRAIATESSGIPELVAAIERHVAYLDGTGERRRRDRQRLQAELDLLLREGLVARWQAAPAAARYPQLIDALIERRLSPFQAVEQLLATPD